MAEFVEVMKQKKRMCDELELDCSSCGLCSDNNNYDVSCLTFIFDHYEQAEEIIMKWAKEHPAKTNADKFKEVFGFEFTKDLHGCSGLNCPEERFSCDGCALKGFWQQEYKEPKGGTNDRTEE